MNDIRYQKQDDDPNCSESKRNSDTKKCSERIQRLYRKKEEIMKCGKKLIGIAVMAAIFSSMSVTAQETDEQIAIPEGAIFHEVAEEDLGIEGSSAYIYVASELYQLPNWETPIIYVYPDQPVEDEMAAWEVMETTGLQTIAEEEHAAVLIVNPVNERWSEEDIDVYNALMGYVFYVKEQEDTTLPGYALSYLNMQYMIGEGSGATFINEYMTQNVNRIAAVMTFGGEMPEVSVYDKLPAYLVGSDSKEVNFYKAANEVNREKKEDGKTIYYSEEKPVNQVIVNDIDITSFDADLIYDAYYSLFRWTMRMSLTTQINQDFYTSEIFTLIERPNLEELGLTRIDVYDTGVEGQSRWVLWIPNEALEEGNTEKFPLVIDHHGGHVSPGFEPEAQGWIQLAGEERFFVFAPEGPEKSDGAQMNLEALQTILEQYPMIDASRIYAAGFSRGGGQVNELIMEYSEILAAASCMASADAGLSYEDSESMQNYELPWIFSVGTGERPNGLNERDILGVNSALLMNHLDVPEEYDYETYPYWGIKTEIGGLNYTTVDGFDVVSGIVRNEEGIPMVQFTYVTELMHVHYTEYARIHWDFMKNYARDLETGEVIYLPDAE